MARLTALELPGGLWKLTRHHKLPWAWPTGLGPVCFSSQGQAPRSGAGPKVPSGRALAPAPTLSVSSGSGDTGGNQSGGKPTAAAPSRGRSEPTPAPSSAVTPLGTAAFGVRFSAQACTRRLFGNPGRGQRRWPGQPRPQAWAITPGSGCADKGSGRFIFPPPEGCGSPSPEDGVGWGGEPSCCASA